MVTPVTAKGELDEAAVDRLVDSLVAGGVAASLSWARPGKARMSPSHTGDSWSSRRPACGKPLLDLRRVGGPAASEFASANDFFRDGAHAVVAHPPISVPVPAAGLAGWYRTLLDQLEGPLILYNMPTTTKVSIPLDAVESLLGHPRLAGIKDSENNPARHEELLRRFGGRPDFAIFVGVGALMEKGLKRARTALCPVSAI